MKKPTIELAQAIAVTAELCGTAFSDPAARVMASDLAQFPEHQVMAALRRCRRELRSTLTLAAILERIEDGRPGPEEAWGAVKAGIGNERITLIWTQEMKAAFFAASPLAGDDIAARMAFLEHYRKGLQEARSSGRALTWDVCEGHDKGQKESAVLDALSKHRITDGTAQALLPHMPCETIAQLAGDLYRKLVLTAPRADA